MAICDGCKVPNHPAVSCLWPISCPCQHKTPRADRFLRPGEHVSPVTGEKARVTSGTGPVTVNVQVNPVWLWARDDPPPFVRFDRFADKKGPHL